ncbi:hypothetical protein ABIE44_003052 [Marmoricola sp. OAE513]
MSRAQNLDQRARAVFPVRLRWPDASLLQMATAAGRRTSPVIELAEMR